MELFEILAQFEIGDAFVLAGTAVLTFLSFQYLKAKKIEQDFRSEHTELSTLIDSFPGFISWFDRDLKYLGVNRELAEINKRRSNELYGARVEPQPNQKSEFIERLGEFRDSDKTYDLCKLKAFLGRQEKHLLVAFKKISNSERIMVMSVDITAQVDLERELEDSRVFAINAARLTALGEMAAGIAHEINNPLAVIAGRTSILRRQLQTLSVGEPKVYDSLAVVARTTERISNIIKGLRMFALEIDKNERSIASVHSLISETLNFCSSRLKNNAIELKITPMESTMKVKCSPSQIMQILLNLFNNAHDAVLNLNDKWIQIEARKENNEVVILITDSGQGIPEQIRHKIMNPFFTTKQPGEGTGLGLSIASSIARSHGGSLNLVESVPNTQFELRLPLATHDETFGSTQAA